MNPPTLSSESTDSPVLSRREALKRAALMLGVALTPSIFNGALLAQPAAAGTKSYFTAKQLATVGAMAERVLPKTDTPGALDAGVPAFIETMARGYLTADEVRTLTAGVADVDARSQAAHQRAFADLTAAQQDALLTKLAEDPNGKSGAFFRQFRELTVVGYFTSELVGKNVLHYDPVPGMYQGCLPISVTGNVNWTK